MRHMVEDLPAAEDAEWAAAHAANQLQEPPIAGAINARGSDDDELDTAFLRAGARMLFAFELGDLREAAGTKRRSLVRGRVLDVPVHADRAAMDDASDPCLC